MSSPFQGDSLTVFTQDKQGRYLNFVFVEGNTFQDLSKLTVTLDHELQHMKRYQEKGPPESRAQDEVYAYSEGIKSVEKIANDLQSKLKDEPSSIRDLPSKLRERLKYEQKMLDFWKTQAHQ